MFLCLLAILIITLIYFKVIKPYNYWIERGVKQRNQIYVLGDHAGIIFRRESLMELMTKLYNEFPNERYIGMYQFFMPTLVVRDPELVKQITIRDFDHFVDHKSFIANGPDPLTSKNLFALKGEEWHDMRVTLSPSFTSNKMKMIFTLISEYTPSFVEYFAKMGNNIINLEMEDVFSRYTNDVIASAAFGIKCDSLRERENEFYVMGTKAFTFTGFWKNFKFLFVSLAPNLCKILGIQLFSNKTIEFFKRIVTETIKFREKNNVFRPDMLHLLMEAKKGRPKHEDKEDDAINSSFAAVEESTMRRNLPINKITDIEIAAQAFVFFFGGFDSVAKVMCLMGHELTTHPKIQKKLQKEIDETMDECQGILTYESLMKMKYMDMVVSETLRLWTPGLVMDRLCVKPYTIEPVKPNEKPIHLQKGDVVWIPTIAFHKDPQYFPNPSVFDPERFNDENKINIKPYTYFPFGLGPRNCIGSRFAIMEIKTLFCYLLSKFDFLPVENTLPLKLKNTTNFEATNGFRIGLKIRTNN